MRKKLTLITIAALFTLNVWGQNEFPTDADVKIDGKSINFIRPSTTGGWARGLKYYNTDETTLFSSFGLYGLADNNIRFYLAHGENPWSSGLGMYILTNGNVGVGITNPIAKLHVVGKNEIDGYNVTAILGNAYDYWTCFGGTTGGRIRGSNEGYIVIEGNPNGTGNNNVSINPTTSSDVILAKGGGNVGIGTTSPIYKLSVNGTIGCGEVIVEDVSTWSDFVFEPDYNLISLKELEIFIKENKHLPEIPTTEEVKENGISVGEMNARLLQKIEEMTLYMIAQEKRIANLEKEINGLKSR